MKVTYVDRDPYYSDFSTNESEDVTADVSGSVHYLNPRSIVMTFDNGNATSSFD